MAPSPSPEPDFCIDPAQPFKGVVVCCTSIPPEQRTDIANRVQELGGIHKYDLTPDATHLVVGDYDTPKYRHVARERQDVKAMDATWIEAMSDVWKQDEEIDFVGLERKHRLKALERSGAETPILAGQSAARQSLLICLTGFGDQRDEIAMIITSNGGRFTGDLTRKCTHLIASKPEGKKFTAAKSWNIYTVTLDWLYQSVERGMILDEAKFDPLLPLEQQGVGAWVKQDPRRTSLGKRSCSTLANRPEEGARKLRKTASMKLSSQRKNLWGDILGKSTSREHSFNEGQRAQTPAQAAPRPEPTAREDEDGVYTNCIFAIHGFDQRRNNVLEETVATLGGTVAPTLERVASGSVRGEPRHRFLIVPQTSQPDTHPRMLKDDVHIVTEFYVERCMHNKRFFPPSEHVLGRPFPLFPIAGFSELTVCSAAFTGLELSQVARSVAQLGATFEEEFRRSTSLVVCKSLQAMRKEKLRYALEWGVPVVSADWLWECISTGFNVPSDAYIFPEVRKQFTSRRLGEAEERGSSKCQQRRHSGPPKLAFPGLGKARPPSEAGLDASAFDRDSSNGEDHRKAKASRVVPHEDSTTSADFMTARTHHADSFCEDSGAPLGKASRARLDKSTSPPKHAAGPTRTRSEPWPRSQGLVWNNYLHPAAATRALAIIDGMEWERGNPPLTTDSMKKLLPVIPYPCPGTDPDHLDPAALIELAVRTELDLREQDPLRCGIYGPGLPRHQAWVFKAMVTPTRIILQGPDAESKNRVLRMFPDRGDHFLRVFFGDENGQDLNFNPRVSNDVVFERYRRVLQDGIRVAGRHFAFLGFSHSSLRSHSTWFLAPFVDQDMQRQDYDTILRTLGDFSEIRIAAKCAARIGQAFSETPYAVDLVKANIMNRSIPDVKSVDGTRVFSDGVGTISPDALEEVWDALPMRSTAPTCLQIRWGGVKGMLSLDSRLRGKVMCVRNESMMKFPSRDQRELGICDVASKPVRLHLNRQIIKILEDMGTADAWFKDLQSRALKMLRGVTATAANTSTFLRYQDIGSALGFPAFIGQLSKMGIDYRRDDFLRSVVEHVVLRELRLLKHKARIPVAKGVTLFGVMDETGFLDEGEVYVAYDKTHVKSGYRMDASLVDGPAIVTRSPALHPGDVQCVQMRTPPPGHALRQLTNCIAFSQRGQRDLPSQLSGGDLDGDLYNVIWDPEARPARVFSPADYPRTRPPELDRPVRRDDIADFFIQFMKTDILGLIANRHLILADVSPEGTCDARCIALAGMHSTSVDFSKTGIPVKPGDMPRPPRTRPDFLALAPPVKLYDVGQIDFMEEIDEDDDDDDGMGGARHRYHRSEKILGHLYRGVDEKKIWNQDIHRTVDMNGPSVWDQLLGLMRAELAVYDIDTGHKRHRDEAWKLRIFYEESVHDSMWHFSDRPRTGISEVEVFCGSVLNKRGSQTRQQRDLSIGLKDEMDRVLTLMDKLIRKRGSVGGLDSGGNHDTDSYPAASVDGSRDREEVIQLCWACLVVGCEDRGTAPEAYRGDGDLRSFRVVAAACLLKEMGIMRAQVSAAMAGGGYLGVTAGRQAQQPRRRRPRAKRAAAAVSSRPGEDSALAGQFEKLELS